jgi:hypothetical protein
MVSRYSCSIKCLAVNVLMLNYYYVEFKIRKYIMFAESERLNVEGEKFIISKQDHILFMLNSQILISF